MSKDDVTWLNVGYIVFFVIVSYVAYRALETFGVQLGWIERYNWYQFVQVLGGVLAGGVSLYSLRMNNDRHEFLLSSIAELRKVMWPTWTDTKRMTMIVCIVVGIFAVIVSIFDVIWARALRMLIA